MSLPSSHPGLGGQEGGRWPARLQCAAPWGLGAYQALGLLSATHLLSALGPGRGGRRASPVGTGNCACKAWAGAGHKSIPPWACTTLPSRGWAALGTDSKPPGPLWWGQCPSAFNHLLRPSSGTGWRRPMGTERTTAGYAQVVLSCGEADRSQI